MKKLLIALLAMVMIVATIGGGLVACDKDMQPIDLTAGKWGPVSDNDPEGIYTVTAGADGGISMAYRKSADWQGTRNIILADAASLGKVKTMMFTASADKQVYVMIKFEFNDERPAVEIPVVLTTTATTYRVDLSGIDMTKAFRIIWFVDPLVIESSGTITIPSMYLIDKDNTADVTELHADVNYKGEENVITATDTKVGKWFDPKSGKVYTVSESNGVYTVNYTKKYDTSWSNPLQAIVTGDLTSFKTFRITLKGTAGQQVMVKPFNNNAFEQTVTFDGTEQEIIIDLTKAEVDAAQAIMLFAAPGSDEGTGTFQILKAEFSAESAPVTEDPNLNTITDTNKTFGKWFDGGDGVYTVTENNGVYTVNYNKTNHEYASVKAKLGGDLDNIVSVKFVLKGTAGKIALVKPFDGFETRVEFTGEEQTVNIPVTGYNKANNMVIMVEGGTAAAQGSMQIISAEVVKANPNLNTITTDDKTVAKWYGEAPYTVIHNDDGTVSITKAANGSWAQIKADVTGAAIENMKTFRITVLGVKDAPIIIKPFNSNGVQQEVRCTGENQVIICDLTKYEGTLDGSETLQILIFYNWDASEESTLTIVSAEFSTEAAPATEEPAVNTINAENKTISKWISSANYTVTEDNGALNVAYNKGEWDTLQANVVGTFEGMASIKIKLQGTVGDSFLIKYDNGDLETVTLTETEQEFIVSLKKAPVETQTTVGIIAAPGTASEGTFKIVSAEFTSETAAA